MGAVNGDHVFLNTVTSARMNPPIAPPIIQGTAASGVCEWPRPHVYAEVTTTHNSSRPVLLAVPCMVIASPAAICPANALSFRTGLLERSMFAMEQSPIPHGRQIHRVSSTAEMRRGN